MASTDLSTQGSAAFRSVILLAGALRIRSMVPRTMLSFVELIAVVAMGTASVATLSLLVFNGTCARLNPSTQELKDDSLVCRISKAWVSIAGAGW